MSFSANNPAGLPHLSQCVVGRATNSPPTRNYGDESRRSCAGHACSNQTAIVLTFRSQCADDNFALARVCRYVSRLCSGTASGLFMRPAAARSSASAAPPCGLRFPSKSCSERTPKRFLRSLRKCRASALGSMAHSLNWCPDQDREIPQTETLMYLSVMWNWGGFASAICRAALGRRVPAVADATMSWLPTSGLGGALDRQITPWRRTE
jgi:hypothetical protein